jgi:DNA-binding MltR family transcriptional regulator
MLRPGVGWFPRPSRTYPIADSSHPNFPHFPSDPFELFYLTFDHGKDRAQAITMPVLLEHLIERVLRAAFRQDDEIANELFRPSGALGNYGTKVRLAYMLGVLSETTYKDFLIIGKIRNKFAHDFTIKEFCDQPIKQWIESLSTYRELNCIRDEEIDQKDPDIEFKTAFKLYLLNLVRGRIFPVGSF